MTLSDFRTGHPPIENVGGATSTSAGYPPITQTTFSYMPCSLPRWTKQVRVGFLPCPRGLPQLVGGSASTTSLSRPAQASLALRPARLLARLRRTLSRGSSPARYPTKPLGSYHVLPTSTWVNPPFTGDLRRWGAQLTSRYAVKGSHQRRIT